MLRLKPPALREIRAGYRLLLACCLLPVAGMSCAQQPTERPDVLFISIDDLNDWIGPLDGHPQALTPNLDRLAAQGMIFTNAHAPSAVCNPSRTAIMTGVSPASSGVYDNPTDWRKVEGLGNLPTIPRYFRDAGYTTQGAGKMFHSSTYNPWAFFGYNDTTAWDAYFPSLERQLPDEVGPPRRPANGSPYSPNFDWAAVSVTDMAMGDGQVVTWSIDNIIADGQDSRFNAVGIYRPHPPWYVPQKYLDMFPLEEIQLPPVIENDLDDIPESVLNVEEEAGLPPMALHRWIVEDPEAERWKQAVQGYLASTTYADVMLGHVLDALEESGRADNTIIVLWADHGWHLGEKERWRKRTLWREATRVPLIVVAPGVTTPGSRSATPVSLMDLYPTLVELAGMQIPDHVEGTSLVPILEDPELPSGRSAVTTSGFGNHAVSGDRYRYIRYVDGSEELYDIESDPHEWTNLAADPDHAEAKAELSEWLPARDAPDIGRNRE